MLLWIYFAAYVAPLAALLFVELPQAWRGGGSSSPDGAADAVAASALPFDAAGFATWAAGYAGVAAVGSQALRALDLHRRERGGVDAGHDVLWGGVACAVLYLNAGVNRRVRDLSWRFVGGVAVAGVAYCVMFELVKAQSLQVTVSWQLSDKLEGVFVALAAFVVVAAYAAHCFLLFRAARRTTHVVAGVVAVAVLHVAALLVAQAADPTTKVHVHHQWWAFLVTFLGAHGRPSRASVVGQAMLIGIHLHGLAAFGAQPNFKH